MNIKAVIFDLDGVIVNTAEHHYRAWKRLADELGIPCPADLKDRVRGVSRRRSLDIILGGRMVRENEAKKLMDRKDSFYRELIRKIGPADLLPGVRELLDDLKENKVRIAVATVSRNAKEVLSRLGILDRFDSLVDGTSGARPKPAPDLFLYAAAQLGIPPSECLVIEDAPVGIEAAEMAGMWSFALGPTERFQKVRANLVAPSLDGMSYQRLLKLLRKKQREIATWLIEEAKFDPSRQRQFETLFTIGNGYLGTRGSLEERYPGDLPATLIAGLYDDIPIFHTELVTVPDWTSFRLVVDKEPFSLRQGTVLSHKRVLDMRDGTLRCLIRWRSPNGHTVEIQTVRFASMADPHLCVQVCAVTALDFDGEVKLLAWLDEKAENPGIPPFPEVGLVHWERLSHGFPDRGTTYLEARTRRSQIELGMAAGFALAGVPDGEYLPLDGPCPGTQFNVHLSPGKTAILTKFVTFYTSMDAKDPVARALEKLQKSRERGYAQVLEDHREAWSTLWEDCDVRIAGDSDGERAVRFNLYHLLIAAPRTERTSIPAKALSGFGYRGHVFWDTDVFILPFFTFTQPEIARRLLMYRYRTLPAAREKARQAGYKGAMYAWESAGDGHEVTPRFVPNEEGSTVPIFTGDLEHHISADIAHAVWQYWNATGDDEFMRDFGAEIILSTARFWASRVEFNPSKNRYEIRDVIGPDEYHERVDNNAFTNWMARFNLKAGKKVWSWLVQRSPSQANILRATLNLTDDEIQEWEEIGDHIELLYDQGSGLIEQFTGYFSLEKVDLAPVELRTTSVYDLFGAKRIRTTQIIKQPDVLMGLFLLSESVDERVLKANWQQYEPCTDHQYGSSLGPAIHAVLGCRVNDQERAYQHFQRAARVDLEDLRGNTVDGIHAASAGGVWQAVVFGFAGLRFTEDGPIAWPQLPHHWKRLRFSLYYRGQKFLFDLTPKMHGPLRPTIHREVA